MRVAPSLPSHLGPPPSPITYPALSYLIIFNPALTPIPRQHADVGGSSSSTIDPDDLKEYAQVLCYVHGPASRKGKEKAIDIPPRDDLLLRRLGLAKGMLGLTDMVTTKPSQGPTGTPWSGRKDFVIVHTAKKRHITCMVEKNVWLHLVIDLTPPYPPPSHSPQTADSGSIFSSRSKTKSSSSTTSGSTVRHKPSTRSFGGEKGEIKLSDEWIQMSVTRAWDEWMLLHGPMDEFLSDKGRETLEEALKEHWSTFCVVWSPAMEAKEMLDDWLGGFPPPSDTITNCPEWKAILQSLPQDSTALLLGSQGPTATSGPINRNLVHHLHRLLLTRIEATATSSTASKATAQSVHAHGDSKRSTSGSWKTLGLGNIMDVEWKPILTLGFAGGRSGDSSRSSSPAPGPQVTDSPPDKTVRPSDPPRTATDPIRAIPVQAKANPIDSTISTSPSKWASGLSSSLRSGLGQMGSGLAAGVSPVTNGVGRVFSGKGGSVEVQDGETVEQPARN